MVTGIHLRRLQDDVTVSLVVTGIQQDKIMSWSHWNQNGPPSHMGPTWAAPPSTASADLPLGGPVRDATCQVSSGQLCCISSRPWTHLGFSSLAANFAKSHAEEVFEMFTDVGSLSAVGLARLSASTVFLVSDDRAGGQMGRFTGSG